MLDFFHSSKQQTQYPPNGNLLILICAMDRFISHQGKSYSYKLFKDTYKTYGALSELMQFTEWYVCYQTKEALFLHD